MPLENGKSKSAFIHNLKAERGANKPMKQSLAIAYSVKRRAAKKASGGMIDYPVEERGRDPLTNFDEFSKSHPEYTGSTVPGDVNDELEDATKGNGYYDGGFVEEEEASGMQPHEGNDVKHDAMAMEEDDLDLNQHGEEDNGPMGAYANGGMIGRIMAKRYSKGGQVANDVGVAESDKLPAEYDDLVLRNDDMEDADYTGANSGDEIGNKGEDERRKDIISRIMASRAKKDRLPRPA